MRRLYAQIPPKRAGHIEAADHLDPPGPHDGVGDDGGRQRPGDAERDEQRKAEHKIDRRRDDHEPLVQLKMAEHRAIAAQHAVVPADIFVQAEHEQEAERQQAVGAHPQRHERLKQAEIGRGDKACKQITEQVHAPEHPARVVVLRGGFVIDDVADGGRKTVQNFRADIGHIVRDRGVVAKVCGLRRAAHAGCDNGIRRAVDRVGQAMDEIVAQVAEDAERAEIFQRDFCVPHIGEVPAEAPGHRKVGRCVEQDGDAEVEHIVRPPQRDRDAQQIGQHIEAEIDARADIALLRTGVHQPPGDKEVT